LCKKIQKNKPKVKDVKKTITFAAIFSKIFIKVNANG